ncbi:putative major facilitator superfamily transporter [Caenibius tardaugens NBRC 16725]|uniref:Putative major facilitator superfamily transporter n=1 Tax=Caenibius tardaugens NBRC 16725 TaxID=1219035 RepID=U2YM52_9SPHN|nr:MFS transporter [Caenibius tardaugens]GAD49775.1 putative major facilitator superfamily transporter [Caenibius tardaugens NBRC 16725]
MNPRPAAEVIEDGLPIPRRYVAIFALSAGTALAVIDGTIANVALPTIARALSVPASQAAHVVTLYQLVLVMALLPLSALGDRIGHRRLYQSGQMIFIVATLACVFATSLPQLLFARALQGLGAAGALSVSSALIRAAYPARQLGRGLGINSMIVASAGALSPTLGGVILHVAPWQWVFAAPVPFALLSLAAGAIALPQPKTVLERYDYLGALLNAATFALLILGLQDLAYGRDIPSGILKLVAGVAAAATLIRQQSHAARPILPLDLLRQSRLAVPVTGLLLAFMAQMILLVSLPFRLAHRSGFTPVEIGGTLSLWPLTLIIVSPLAGMLSDRISNRLLGGVGMAITTAGFSAIALLPDQVSQLDASVRMAICGLGFGLFLSPNARTIIGAAPRTRAAAAGGLMATTRLTGQALGASIAGGLLALGTGDGALPAGLAASVASLIGLACIGQSRPGVS